MCLAHAPTGIGKTLAALLAALPNLPEKGKLLYAVNRKNQIPIVLKELRRINEANGTDYKATAFASKADLCRDREIKKLGYRELLEACEMRREGWTCPYYKALFENSDEAGTGHALKDIRSNRGKSRVAQELERRVLDEMPPPHAIEPMAEEVEKELKAHPVCIYELLKLAAASSDVLVGTLWYYFHPRVAPSHLRSLSIKRKDCILICDEAHNLPKFCRDALSHGLSSLSVEYAIRELKRHEEDLEDVGISREGIESFLTDFLDMYRRFSFTSEGKHLPAGLVKVFMRGKGMDVLEGPIESLEAAARIVLGSLIRQGSPPRSYLLTTASFVRPFLLQGDRSYERFCILSRTARGSPVRRLEIRCLDPAPLASSVLDPAKPTGAISSVLMSGTLVPGDYYKDVLGIPKAHHREFPNIFPAGNRALFLDDTISLAWKSRSDEMYDRITEKMVAIRTHTPGSCMFFFPSYEVMDRVLDRYPDDMILVEKRAQTKRDEVEAALKSGKSVMAVMGASLGEGLDLPGLIKAIAIFGLPLEKISDLIKLGMRYYDGQFPGKGRDYFYYLPAVTKIVQSAGRAHRKMDDKAAIYVLDRRFCRRYLTSAPSWWRDEATKIQGTESLVAKTKAFWGGKMPSGEV